MYIEMLTEARDELPLANHSDHRLLFQSLESFLARFSKSQWICWMLVHAPIAAYTFIHLLSWLYSYLEVGQTITLDKRCQGSVDLDIYKSSSAGYLCSEVGLPRWCHMLPHLMTSVDAEMPKKALCKYKMDLSLACICWKKLIATDTFHEITSFSKYRITLLLFLKQFYDS